MPDPAVPLRIGVKVPQCRDAGLAMVKHLCDGSAGEGGNEKRTLRVLTPLGSNTLCPQTQLAQVPYGGSQQGPFPDPSLGFMPLGQAVPNTTKQFMLFFLRVKINP